MTGSATQHTGKQLYSYNQVYRKIEVLPWEQWFAWHPVKVNGKRVWLKTVYRRCINTYVDFDDWSRYEYGNLFDIIAK